MNKSVILKNKIILYFSFLITFFISIYLIYFFVNGQRGLLKYFYLQKQNIEFNKTINILKIENDYYVDRIKRLQPNTIDLDFLDENVRKNLGFIDKNERVIILNK
tara:strand:- start:62 stop:376 length:315 start_codon:yes stop_codon:yes gene_type:complete